ncbi:MAG: DNA polymerase III subunit gamma/tau [Tidjanibacter sp.]|nr:DNA polymerase III subunit gamma/tau [Tidjanibacter sp.]
MDNNFIVSARKYRPQTFESVVGQSHITTTLKNAIERGQLAHAYLFCGPRGVGKTTCARIFAKTINCLNPTASGDACGECESCRSFNEGRSFSIHELDAASNNSVENIRDLTDQVRVPPQVGRYSVYIIDEVHMLSQAAFNAFLKTLEEPPQHAIFVLATTEKHKIIPTILSRCQIYDFQRIRLEDTVEYLKTIATREGVEFDDESLHLIAIKSDGGMRDALSMFDKAVSFCGGRLEYKEVAATLNVLDYDTYFAVTRALYEGDYKTALNTFDEVLKKGFSGQTFASGLASHMRDLLMCKDPQTLPLLELTGSILARYKEQSAVCDASFLFNAISLLGALDGGFRTATNQRLHIELGLMKLSNLSQKKTFDVIAPTLPPLQKEQVATTQTAVAQQVSTQSAKPASSAPAQVAAPQEAPKAPAPQAPTPASSPQATASVAPQAPQSVTPSVASIKRSSTPVSEADAKAAKKLFGSSISDIINGRTRGGEEEEKAVYFDPQTGQKINNHWGEFMERLTKEHPRLGNAMKDTKVSGHTLSMAVSTEIIRDEILRNQPEITALLAECCGVEGSIILDVEVKMEQDNTLPHRTIDKLHFLVEKNPELNNLIQDLGLDLQ